MSMTWEERFRTLSKALKKNKEFWVMWMVDRTTPGPIRDFFAYPDEEIQAAVDFREAFEAVALDMQNDPDSAPTEVEE